MHLSYCKYALRFKHPFGLSLGTRTHTDVVYVKLEKDGFTGYGEAALPPYLGVTQEDVIKFLRRAKHILASSDLDPFIVLPQINSLSSGDTAAKAAIDMAIFDLIGKTQGRAVHELLAINKPSPKATSATIAIGDLSTIREKIEELEAFQYLKVKLGNPNDKEIISEIRRHCSRPLAVDVNQGWQTKEHALEMINWLAEKNILYVEQPLHKENFSDTKWLRERSPLPLIADESFQGLTDLHRASESFHGINIKLMKCGGLLEGSVIIRKAKKIGLKINIGCMSESSCGIAAAAQLAAEADWLDLDGPILVSNDPFAGVSYINGNIQIQTGVGTGTYLADNTLIFTLL